MSAGYFRKDVKNFVVNNVVNDTPFDLPFPLNGPLGDAARAALGAPQPPEIYNWILENLPDEEGVDAERGIIAGVDGRDPLTNFAGAWASASPGTAASGPAFPTPGGKASPCRCRSTRSRPWSMAGS